MVEEIVSKIIKTDFINWRELDFIQDANFTSNKKNVS